MTGWRCREKIDGCGSVMDQREADLAIVVNRCWRLRAARRGDDRSPRRERQRVMVPSEEHRLEENRKDAEKCGRSAGSRQPLRPYPSPCGNAHMHVDLTSRCRYPEPR